MSRSPEGRARRPIELLLVEDNEGDVRLMKECLCEISTTIHLHVAYDGEEALQFLQRQKPFEKVPVPDLILLDLNLPKVPGTEVLTRIRADVRLRRIPVVVLSSSRAESDVNGAYDRGASSYIPKPANLEDVYRLARALEQYWFRLTLFPAVSL